MILLFNAQLFAQKDLVISGGTSVSSLVCSNNKIYVWGDHYGANPTPITIMKSGVELNIRQVNSGSGSHFIALGCDGTIWAWGNNSLGQVGNGSSGQAWVATPTQVCASPEIDAAYKDADGKLINASVVYAGNSNSFAILENGDLVAWGANSNRRAGGNTSNTGDTWNDNSGQLGNGNTTDQLCAVYVRTPNGQPLHNVIQVFAGDNTAMALTSDGTVYSWGAGYHGLLGRNALGTGNPNSNNPVHDSYARPVYYAGFEGSATGPMNNIVSINCADAFGMALDTDGYIWAWGNGGWNNSTGTSYGGSAPHKVKKGTTVGGSNDGTYLLAKAIGGGQGFGMAVTIDGKPVAWGGSGCSDGGVTGNNSLTGSPNGHGDQGHIGNAVYIQYGTSAAQVHNDVILINRGDTWGFYGRSDGSMWTWGCNSYGQLGTGNTTDRAYAVPITPPSSCDFKDPLPTVNITPKSIIVCQSDLVAPGGEQILDAGYNLGSTLAPFYTITWYKDNVQVKQGTANIASNQKYTATSKGLYKVEIEYTGSNNGCDAYPIAKDSMEITYFEQNYTIPTDLTYCADKAEVYVIPKSATSKAVYKWYPNTISTTALGTTIGDEKKELNVASLPVTTGTPNTKTIYVEETSYAAGTILKKNQGCNPLWTGHSLDVNPGVINIGNTFATGFTVYETITITELSFMFGSSINTVGQSGTATIAMGIYGSTTNNGGLVANGSDLKGTLTVTYNRTRESTEAQDLDVQLTAKGSITLQPGTYFIGPRNYATTGNLNNPKIKGSNCKLSSGIVDDVTGQIIKQDIGVSGYNNPNQTNSGFAFDIKFETQQQFCDRIPVILSEDCPCNKPDEASGKRVEITTPTGTKISGDTVMLCAGESVNLAVKQLKYSGANATNQFDIIWYQAANKGSATTPLKTPVNAGIDSYTVNAWTLTNPSVAETKRYYVKVQDHSDPSAISCWVWDSIEVKVIPELNAGTIATNQTICYNTTPSALTSTAAATGGIGTYAYQWQGSTNSGASWTNIAGATTVVYAPGALNTTTQYRRRVANSNGICDTVYSNTVTITVNPELNAGTIAADQTICYNTTPSALTSTSAATGGTGTYAYQWQSSPNGTTWTDIGGATAVTYAPGALTATTYYRRQAKNSNNTCDPVYSDTVTITVNPELNAGTIATNQTICYNATPSALTSTSAATGGTGTYAYQWQSSPDGTTWTDISGYTAVTYAPGALTATTYYRRQAKNSDNTCDPVYSNTVTITVNPELNAGTIATDQTICYNATPGALTSTTAATGGTGTYAYQWQSSADGTTWTDISGSTAVTYAPGALTATTYYRRQAKNSDNTCDPVYSNTVTITVNPELNAGTIATDQTICYNATPGALTSTTAATGGTGTYAYQWQSSADGTTWTDIGGATVVTYAPGALTATTYYRRQAKNSDNTCDPVYSNVVTVTVNPLPTIAVASATICEGSSTTLTASGANTYIWSPATGLSSTTGTSVTANPVATVTYTIEGTDANGCKNTTTATVTVNSLPTVAVDNNPTICAGNSATLTASGADTYIWSPAAGLSSTTDASVTANPAATETYTVEGTDANGCKNTATATVTVNPLPTIAVASATICEGSSTTLTASGADTYTWSPAAGLSSTTGTSVTASPAATVTYTVEGTDANGCKNTATATVTVNPLPTIAVANATICEGSSTTLTASGANTYTWSPATGLSSTTGTSVTANPVATVTYTIEGTNANGCKNTTTATVAVNVVPGTPVTQTVDFLKGTSPNPESIAAGATADGSNVLYWYSTETSNDGTTTTPLQNKDVSGTYYYWVSQRSPEGCESIRVRVTVNVFDAPVPKVKDIEVCVNENVDLTTLAQADPNHTLSWYTNGSAPKGSGSPSAPSVNTGTPGEYKFYVSQINGTTHAESEKAVITVTVYGVEKPTVTPAVAYCIKDNSAVALSATENTSTYYPSSGLEWYKDGVSPGNKLPGAPVPGTNQAGDTEYWVRQYYTIPASSSVCYGDALLITVTINETNEPTGEFTVNYLKKEAEENGNVFPDNLLQKNPQVALTNPSCVTCSLVWFDSNKNQLTGTPTPVYDPTVPPGDDKEERYYVAQYNSATGCMSDLVEVIVIISDSPMPKVTPLSYCEGETPAVLTAEIEPADGFTVADYELVWYNGDPANGGTEVPSVTPVTNITNGLAQQEYIYYVAQRRTDAGGQGAISTPSKLRVTIYANPVISAISPAPSCETNIEIKNTWTVNNSVPVVTRYYSDAAAISEITSLISSTGTYYIQSEFTMPVTHAGSATCKSNIVSVYVDIHDLKIVSITGDPEVCPGESGMLYGEAVSINPGNASINFQWSGDNNISGSGTVDPVAGKTEISTGILNGVAYDTYKFRFKASAGACIDKLSPEFTVTIGDAPVVGKMTLTETGNTLSPAEFVPGNTHEFYSCGENVEIATSYEATAGTPYQWYKDGFAIPGASGIIPGTAGTTVTTTGINYLVQNPTGTSTYKLEYINGCKTSVEVKIHAIPLTVTSLPVVKMGLCEGEAFSALLQVNCAEYPWNTQIEWFQNGVLLPSTTDRYEIASALPEHSGIYTYKVTNRGCVVTGTIEDAQGESNLQVSAKVQYSLLPDVPVCGGSEATIGLSNVYPSTTDLQWLDPGNVIQGSTSGKTVLARLPYQGGNGIDPSVYTFIVQATNEYCTMSIEVKATVDAPLKGQINAIEEICEGQVSVIDASSYYADIYTWHSTAYSGFKHGPVQNESPVETAEYYVEMSRGTCQATDQVTVKVNSKPQILAIDSIGKRDVNIIALEGRGTQPFLYGVDDQNPTDDSRKYDLRFGKHSFYIVDALGCRSELYSEFLEAPKIYPPAYFTPNGDGVNDTWEVVNLREVYPEALVTIFDRFGKKLAEYKGEESGWDGSYLGNSMPSTDYWYQIDIDEIDKQYVGHFTLIRR
jgi:gliding motility-associated-like protein